MTKIIDTNMGKVATSPSNDNNGQYSDQITYKRYEMTLHDYDAWVSKKDGNKGHTPVDGSPWWFRATNGGKYARQVADQAVSDAGTATTHAENVNAVLSTQQGAVLLTVTNRNGVSVTKDVGWRIYRTYATKTAMDADAANVEEGKFTMITSNVEDPDNAKMYVRSGYPADDPDTTHKLFNFVCDFSGAQGMKGDPFTYEDFTPAQIAELQQPAAAMISVLQQTNADVTAAEDLRVQAEGARAAAEQDREDDFAAAIDAAEQATEDAQTQGNYAKTQGDRAKEQADHPDEIRSDGYIYSYDPDNAGAGEDGYYKTDRHVVANLDITALTPQQKQELIDEIKAALIFASVAEAQAAANELT